MEITYRGESVRVATGGRSHDSDFPGIVLIHGSGMDRTVWQMQSRGLPITATGLQLSIFQAMG